MGSLDEVTRITDIVANPSDVLVMPSLSTIRFRYDPASLSALSDGDNVTSMTDDQPTLPMDLTSGGATGATYRDGIITAGPNGKPFLSLVDAVNHLTHLAALQIMATDDVSLMVVIRVTAIDPVQACFMFTKDVEDQNFICGIRAADLGGGSDVFQFQNRNVTDKALNTTGQPRNIWYVLFTDTHDGAIRPVEHYVNDPVTPDASTPDLGNDIIFSNGTAKRIVIGSRDASADNLSDEFDWAFAIGWDGNISAGDRATAMNNAKAFFGI